MSSKGLEFKPAPTTASAILPPSAVSIKMKDLAAFKWLIINMFGHDYMHDYMINTERCKSKPSVIEQINKLMSIIAGYKKTKTSKIRKYFGKMEGGGKNLQKGGVGGFDDDDIISNINNDTLSLSYLENIETSIKTHNILSTQINSQIENGDVPDLGVSVPKPDLMEWWKKHRDGENSVVAENIYIIVQEEKYLDDLIHHGMKKNFDVLSEILVGNILSEPIKNIVELTTSIGKFLNPVKDDWEEEDERSYGYDHKKMIDDMSGQFALSDEISNMKFDANRTSKYQQNEMLLEIKTRFEKISPKEINNQILHNVLELNEKNAENVYNIKNKKLDAVTKLSKFLDTNYGEDEKNKSIQLYLGNIKNKIISGEDDTTATEDATPGTVSSDTSTDSASSATSTGTALPATSTGTVLSDTSTGTALPATSTGTVLSDTSTDSASSDTSTGTVLSATSTGTVLSDTSTGSALPATSTGTVLSDTSTDSASSDTSTGSALPATSTPTSANTASCETKGDNIKTVITDSGLFDFTKNIIFGEILKTSTSSSTVSLFDSNGNCRLYDISINSIKKLSNMFYGIYKSTIIDVETPTFNHETDYFFEDPRKRELMLLRGNVYNIFDIIKPTDKQKNEFERAFVEILGDVNKKSFKNINKFVLLNYHPDKIKGVDEIDSKKVEEIMTYIIINLSILGESFMKGGAKKKGTKKKTTKKEDEEADAFLGINKLLGKSILENSLTLMTCVNGNKSFGYFPNINKLPNPVNTDYKLFYKKYPGIKPKFVNIFNGEGVITEMTNDGYYDKVTDTIKWELICPYVYSPGKVGDASGEGKGAPLEFRKLIARRILLNIQVLILYIACCPDDITTSNLLQGLYLTTDKTARNIREITTRGFWGPPNKSDERSIKKHIKITGADNGTKEIEEFVKKNRTKWFGFMFDFYEKDPPKSGTKVWTEYHTQPLWLTSKTKSDDALQYSFNIVLQHLLPEFVLYMGEHNMFSGTQGRKNFIRKKNEQVGTDLPLPPPGETSGKAYIISNASKYIFPSQKKAGESRFGLFNLDGANTRDLNYCSVPSIADNQPTCSVTLEKTASSETYPRSHEYDLEMSVEAEDAIGQIYSYVIEMTKTSNSRTSYYISAALSMPLQPSILIGDKTKINDLKGSPLGAVSSFLELLKSMNTELESGDNLSNYNGTICPPREILQEFFKTNMEIITKMSVKKSIGDYGQEHVAACKFGSGVPSEVMDPANGYNNVLPYSNDGNSLRMMLANDRPSAYRNIFMLLFSEEDSVNSRAVAGYWNENPIIDPKKGTIPIASQKNTIVISPATILPDGHSERGTSVFNTSPKTDEQLGFLQPRTQTENAKFRQEKIREKIRNVGNIRTRRQTKNAEYDQKRRSTRGFTKWLKGQPPDVHEHLSNVGPYIKKNLMEKLKDIYIKEGRKKTVELNDTGTDWVQLGTLGGGRRKRKTRKTKKRRSLKRKKRTKRRSTKRKRKTIKKRKKKRRHRTRRK